MSTRPIVTIAADISCAVAPTILPWTDAAAWTASKYGVYFWNSLYLALSAALTGEASSAGPIKIAALHPLNINARL